MDASVPLDTGTHSKNDSRSNFCDRPRKPPDNKICRTPRPEGGAAGMAQREQIACRILVDRIWITGVQRALPDKNWKRVVFLTVNE